MVSEGLEIAFSVEIFFSLYSIGTSNGGWVSLSGMLGKAPLRPHSTHYENWKKNLSKCGGKRTLA